ALVFLSARLRRGLLSFPTRRSSDLSFSSSRSSCGASIRRKRSSQWLPCRSVWYRKACRQSSPSRLRSACSGWPHATPSFGACLRSEEHTSELQSRENLVCRLLLEKK